MPLRPESNAWLSILPYTLDFRIVTPRARTRMEPVTSSPSSIVPGRVILRSPLVVWVGVQPAGTPVVAGVGKPRPVADARTTVNVAVRRLLRSRRRSTATIVARYRPGASVTAPTRPLNGSALSPAARFSRVSVRTGPLALPPGSLCVIAMETLAAGAERWKRTFDAGALPGAGLATANVEGEKPKSVTAGALLDRAIASDAPTPAMTTAAATRRFVVTYVNRGRRRTTSRTARCARPGASRPRTAPAARRRASAGPRARAPALRRHRGTDRASPSAGGGEGQPARGPGASATPA